MHKNYQEIKNSWKLDRLSGFRKFTACFFLILILISVMGCSQNNTDKTIDSGTSTFVPSAQQSSDFAKDDQAQSSNSSLAGLPEEQKGYSSLLDLDFDDPHDLDYVSFDTENSEDQITDKAALLMDPQDLLHNGALDIKFLNDQQKYDAVLSYPLAVGEGLFWQFILNQQTCFSIHLDALTSIGFEAESYASPRFFVRGSGSAFLQDQQGTIIFHPNQAVDHFFWLEEQQVFNEPKTIFNSIFWDPENPAAYFISRVVLPNFDAAHNVLNFELCDDSLLGKLSIEKIQIIGGEPTSFLMDTSTSFQRFAEEMNSFFKASSFFDKNGAQ